ncbi:MAG TPA: restriction endonuclease subunit S, partial [Bacteroidales bacterium]|nr:restriction endonuclease subunit S [Bacteroidales bacterium]
MSEWNEYKLGELAEITSAKRIFYSEYVPQGVPFYRSKEVIDKFNKRDVQTELFITEEKFDAIRTKFGVPEKDDVLLTSVGTLGIPYLVGEKDRFYFKDGNLTWFRNINKNKIDVQYLFIWLQSIIGKQKLDEITIGSTQSALTIQGLKSVSILLPELKKQTAIASILSSLDDKIDLLHRQNKTLEQMAETLFRQWFLPASAGQAGVEEADESWEEKGLDEIAEFLNGLACQNFPVKPNEVGLPVIKIKEMRTGITETSDIATHEIPEKYIVEDGDMLFSWSGSLDVILWSGGKGVLNQHLFKVTSTEFPQWFYYFWVKHHILEFQGIAADKATTMGHIQRHHLSNAMVIVPPKNKLIEMDETVNPVFQKIKSNTKQIRTLTQLR